MKDKFLNNLMPFTSGMCLMLGLVDITILKYYVTGISMIIIFIIDSIYILKKD